MKETRKRCLQLLSGGIDSTALLHYYISLGFEVVPVFVDYGQAGTKMEEKCARAVTQKYAVKLEVYHFEPNTVFYQGEIIGRNAFLILLVLLTHPGYRGIIALGIHSGVQYYDCSPAFLADMNKIVAEYTDGEALIDAPFLRWNKQMIFQYCRENNVPLDITYSCENGTVPPCGKCNSCLDRVEMDVG